MITLDLSLPSACYPIHIGRGLLEQIGSLLPEYRGDKVAVVSNETIAPLYLTRLTTQLEARGLSVIPIILPDGEDSKDWQNLQAIFDVLLRHNCERHTLLIALGGGVIGDMTGFAAACYQRGAPFVQIPTSLLAQVDASVGGKTAINHPQGKNMIGAFYQPRAVIADMALLDTLPLRELRAGLAEVIKYGLLGDATFFSWLEDHMAALLARDHAALAHAVYRCCQMKADIVAQDEKEHGNRALLNLGHTFGHAIETGLGYGQWLHGEAVAAGMVLAAELSAMLGQLDPQGVTRLRQLNQSAGLPILAPDLGPAHWLSLMRHDKKVSQGRLRLILLRGIGQAYIEENVNESILNQLLSGNCILPSSH